MAQAVSEFARAKVNLALHVLGRRADGLHDLDSIVAFANVGDELSFEEAERFEIAASGPFAGSLPAEADNMIARTWKLLSEVAGPLPAVRITLTKNLPVAAGLGGGSANAAATFRGLMRLFGVKPANVEALAMRLGADVPVCLRQECCRLQGAGEKLVPIERLGPIPAVLVNPLVEVPTAQVFRELGLGPLAAHGKQVDPSDPSSWRNDLTGPAMKIAPVIGEVLDAIGRHAPARMSGSGATCFGLFGDAAAATSAEVKLRQSYPHWWVKSVILG